jgi:lipid-A-disaccharide synthase
VNGALPRPLSIYLVAAEESGDALGAALVRALRAGAGGVLTLAGVGGRAMAAEGVVSPFPIDQLAIVGVSAIPARLPLILRRIREAADAIVAARPDALVIIDSPDFTHRVARRVRARAPSIPIIDYVSPSVWAWRSGRARAMRAYVDCVLAILPFEPAAHRRLGGPPCVYVGHPLIERLADLRPDPREAERRRAEPPFVLILPGSRSSEIRLLLAVFGEAIARVSARIGAMELVLPTMPHLLPRVRAGRGHSDQLRRIGRPARSRNAQSEIEHEQLVQQGIRKRDAHRHP